MMGLTASATLTEAEGQQVRGHLVLAQTPQPTEGVARTAAQHHLAPWLCHWTPGRTQQQEGIL